MAWASHLWTAENSIAKTVLVNNINKKRTRGPPKQRWSEWNGGLNHEDNREEWKKLLLAEGLNGL